MFKKTCELLAHKKISLFFIESASAGYLSYQFSLSPFSGDILIGSLVCYDLKVKEKVLKISPNLIKKYSAESIQVTEEMIKKGKKYLNQIFIFPVQDYSRTEALKASRNLSEHSFTV